MAGHPAGAVTRRPSTMSARWRPSLRPTTTAPAAVPTTAAPAIRPERLVFDSDRSGNFEIYLVGVDGSGLRQVTMDPQYDSWWPRVAPDGKHMIFYRTPAGSHDRDYTVTSLWTMNTDGTGVALLRAAGTDQWEMQGHAEWSPDGNSLAMFGGLRINPQIFITDSQGRNPRQVTDRGGQNLDPSWSPDGRRLAFVGCPQAVCYETDYEIYTISASASPASQAVERITDDHLRDHDPQFRPDGNGLSWLTATGGWSWNIRARIGSDPIRMLTNDQYGINSRPEWGRDGTTVYFHRVDESVGRFRLYALTQDGTRRELAIGTTGNDEYPGRA